jgi:N-acetylglucosamine kinase-like BadF-type ATPase
MKYYLGIDVGSSKTHTLIVDETGQCVGFGKSTGGNHQSAGYDGQILVMQESFRQASEMSGVDAAGIAGAGFGVAGYDFPSDREMHLKSIATLNLSCPFEVENDGFNGLYAGTTHGFGVNVTAGSSNNCRGRNRHGHIARIVGNGIAFGEFGGGLEIAMRALQMVNYAWIRRGPKTALTKILLDVTGARDEMDLMEGISNGQYHITQHLAPDVFRAANEGDQVAREIIQWAGEELGWLAVAAARQLEMEKDEVEVVQSGSVFEGGPLLMNSMRDVVLRHVPKAKLIRLGAPPAVGSVLMGMECAGFDGYKVRDKIMQTAKELVK